LPPVHPEDRGRYCRCSLEIVDLVEAIERNQH
jgi:hypothetical protein